MMAPRSRGAGEPGQTGETGAVLVFVALLLTALLGIAALVVDIAALRLDRREDRAATDAASTAGAVRLADTNEPAAACEAAWHYAVRNLGIDPSTAPSPCSAAFPGGPCNPTDTRVAAATVGLYDITIVNPVVDTSPYLRSPLEGGGRTQLLDANTDGAPCDRVAVRVRRTRSLLFGQLFGAGTRSTTVHSVARANNDAESGRILPSLVALEPSDCQSINAGTGEIIALAQGNLPGRIYADSTASGASCGYVFRVKNSGRIHARNGADGEPGTLGYVAPTAKAFEPAGGASYQGTRVALDEPLTRAPADFRYHCTRITNPCRFGRFDPIQDIQNRYAGASVVFPGAFQTFPGPSQSCSSPPSSFASGSWLINCSTFTPGGTVTFGGGGTIVFNGSVDVGGTLVINPPTSTTDATVVIRGPGGLTVSSNSTLSMHRTMVYAVNGGINLQGGPTVQWTAPEAGPLRDLMYWTESTATHTIQGGPSLQVEGIAVFPNAPLSIQGSGVVDASNMQMWLRNVETQGAAQLLLRPHPNRALSILGASSVLIR